MSNDNELAYLEYLNTAFVPFASEEELTNFSFETSKGIYIEQEVTGLLGKELEFTQMNGVVIAGYRLLMKAPSSDFSSELGDKKAFVGEEGKKLLKLLLATLVLQQKEGESGTLIEDGTENVFFFKEDEESLCHEIEVFRDNEAQNWYFHLAEPNECRWKEESRIFKFVNGEWRLMDRYSQ